MSISRLQQLADDFTSVPADEWEELAHECREAVLRTHRVRYLVLSDCLLVSSSFFSKEDDVGFMPPETWTQLADIWDRYLPGIWLRRTKKLRQLSLVVFSKN